MVDKSDISTVLLIAGILTGLQFTYMAESDKGLPFVDNTPAEHGFYMFDFGSSTCRFFSPGVNPPSNLSKLSERRKFSCAGVWEKYYIQHQISRINMSTNSSEVKNILQSSRRNLEDGNTSRARKELEKIEVRREYHLINTSLKR